MGKTELSLQRSMINMFQERGFDAKAPAKYETQLGQPDVFVALGANLLPVEVKYAKSTFAFAQWAQEQREWAMWYWESHLVATHIALFAGSDHINSRVAGKKPTRLWIVPFHYWLQVEDIMKGRGRKSIPYSAPKTQKGYDLCNLIPSRFSYKYKLGVGWRIEAGNRWSDRGVLREFEKKTITLEAWRDGDKKPNTA